MVLKHTHTHSLIPQDNSQHQGVDTFKGWIHGTGLFWHLIRLVSRSLETWSYHKTWRELLKALKSEASVEAP